MKINIKVKPNSKQQKIEAITEDNFVIHLKSPPVDGKANKELIEILATKFKVTKSQIIIKSGLTSKTKLIEINF